MNRSSKLSDAEQSKFGPGAKAKVDARRNTTKGSVSFLIPGTNEFI